MEQKPCPICQNKAKISDPDNIHNYEACVYVECRYCGNFIIDYNLILDDIKTKYSDVQLALLRHIMAKNNWRKGQDRLYVANKWIKEQLQKNKLPNPKELRDNFIMWLAEKTEVFGINISVEELDNIIYQLGAIDDVALYKIVIWCQNVGLVERSVNLQQSMNNEYTKGQIKPLELTLEGWEYYESIKSSNEDSKTAFMAMPFNNPDLDTVFKNYWIPAVQEAGFTLERLDKREKAGSIDDRLRQTIRRSAFLVCELTTGNKGAYWEAGFAEGIGIPVIYTCSEEWYKKEGTHFDVNHHLCVIWKDDNLKEKQEQLTAIIRETFHERLSS